MAALDVPALITPQDWEEMPLEAKRVAARTRGMNATTRGPIKANVGVSMPGARDDNDWV